MFLSLSLLAINSSKDHTCAYGLLIVICALCLEGLTYNRKWCSVFILIFVYEWLNGYHIKFTHFFELLLHQTPLVVLQAGSSLPMILYWLVNIFIWWNKLVCDCFSLYYSGSTFVLSFICFHVIVKCPNILLVLSNFCSSKPHMENHC